MAFLQKILASIPKTEGSHGKITLGVKQLAKIANSDPQLGKIITNLAETAENPVTAEIAYKAKANYSIAAINLKDGKKSIANAAVSITDAAHPENAVIKARASIGENGKIVQANGFVNGSGRMDANNASLSASRKNNVTSTSARSGDAMGFNAVVDEMGAEKIIGNTRFGEKIHEAFYNKIEKLQTNLDGTLKGFRNLYHQLK